MVLQTKVNSHNYRTRSWSRHSWWYAGGPSTPHTVCQLPSTASAGCCVSAQCASCSSVSQGRCSCWHLCCAPTPLQQRPTSSCCMRQACVCGSSPFTSQLPKPWAAQGWCKDWWIWLAQPPRKRCALHAVSEEKAGQVLCCWVSYWVPPGAMWVVDACICLICQEGLPPAAGVC